MSKYFQNTLYMNSLGPNLWMFLTGNTDASVTDTFKKRRGVDHKTSQYLVWPPFVSSTATSSSHRVDQAVDRGMLYHFNGCVKWLDIGGNWNTLSYTLIQSIPNLLNRCLVCRPWQNWDMFRFQEFCTDPCDICFSIRMTIQFLRWAILTFLRNDKSDLQMLSMFTSWISFLATVISFLRSYYTPSGLCLCAYVYYLGWVCFFSVGLLWELVIKVVEPTEYVSFSIMPHPFRCLVGSSEIPPFSYVVMH
jgi:hypothetical protein